MLIQLVRASLVMILAFSVEYEKHLCVVISKSPPPPQKRTTSCIVKEYLKFPGNIMFEIIFNKKIRNGFPKQDFFIYI